MSLMVKDKQFFKNYNKIWEKTESLMRKKFDSKPFYRNNDNNYINTTKKKPFKNSIITNGHNKKEPKGKILYKYLSIIVLYSVLKTYNNYYPQTLLEECVYKQQKQKQQKQKNYITEDIKSESESNNESESESELESESESNRDSNDETKSDIDNDE